MKYNKKAEELADLIEANSNVEFAIDNDCWYINRKSDGKEIASSDQHYWSTDWYSGSNQYGAGLAEALVILLNRKGFNIEASAV
jgi:hypothetical protein